MVCSIELREIHTHHKIRVEILGTYYNNSYSHIEHFCKNKDLERQLFAETTVCSGEFVPRRREREGETGGGGIPDGVLELLEILHHGLEMGMPGMHKVVPRCPPDARCLAAPGCFWLLLAVTTAGESSRRGNDFATVSAEME